MLSNFLFFLCRPNFIFFNLLVSSSSFVTNFQHVGASSLLTYIDIKKCLGYEHCYTYWIPWLIVRIFLRFVGPFQLTYFCFLIGPRFFYHTIFWPISSSQDQLRYIGHWWRIVAAFFRGLNRLGNNYRYRLSHVPIPGIYWLLMYHSKALLSDRFYLIWYL